MHRSATVYFGRESHVAIVAPMHVNQDGIGYEQETVRVLPRGHSPAELGTAVKEALSAFSEQRCDLRSRKKTDWPAFQAIGVSSVARFETEFMPVSVSCLNASGAVARAEASLPGQDDLGVCCTFNPRLPAEEIGRRLTALLRVYAVAAKAVPMDDPELNHLEEYKALSNDIALYEKEMHRTWLWAIIPAGAIYTWLPLHQSELSNVPLGVWFIPAAFVLLCFGRYWLFAYRIRLLAEYQCILEERVFKEEEACGVARWNLKRHVPDSSATRRSKLKSWSLSPKMLLRWASLAWVVLFGSACWLSCVLWPGERPMVGTWQAQVPITTASRALTERRLQFSKNDFFQINDVIRAYTNASTASFAGVYTVLDRNHIVLEFISAPTSSTNKERFTNAYLIQGDELLLQEWDSSEGHVTKYRRMTK
jgi:hypothetical protein